MDDVQRMDVEIPQDQDGNLWLPISLGVKGSIEPKIHPQ